MHSPRERPNPRIPQRLDAKQPRPSSEFYSVYYVLHSSKFKKLRSTLSLSTAGIITNGHAPAHVKSIPE